MRKLFKKKSTDEDTPSGLIRDNEELMAIRPRTSYRFSGDYFMIDDEYAMITTIVAPPGVNRGLPVFWGTDLLPRKDIDPRVSFTLLEQYHRESEGSVNRMMRSARNTSQMKRNVGDDRDDNVGHSERDYQLSVINDEIRNGGTYLNVHFRILIKAPTLDVLDDTLDKVNDWYSDKFSKLVCHPYVGDQKAELSNLFRQNQAKEGTGFYFTNIEYAGAYSLVSRGFEDNDGEYVGVMVGDYNTSGILFDVNNWKRRVVVGIAGDDARYSHLKQSHMWASKIAQAALLENQRVVHLILDKTNLDLLGPAFKNSTHYINMNKGDVNMFELFGEKGDEARIFATHMYKLRTLLHCLMDVTKESKTNVDALFSDILEDFYVGRRMWVRNVTENKSRVRILGIPHSDVPLLKDFILYLNDKLTKLEKSGVNVDAIRLLYSTFSQLLTENGDLFNTHTNDRMCDITRSKRIIYDFSELVARDPKIALAQIVNVFGMAVNNTNSGDILMIHGADGISSTIREFVERQIEGLLDRGGRVAYIYDDIDKMLDQSEFNKLDRSDYCVLGTMTKNQLNDYETYIRHTLPYQMQTTLVTSPGTNNCFIRRGMENTVFQSDLSLGIRNKKRKDSK